MTPKYYVVLDDGTEYGPLSHKKAEALMEEHHGSLMEEHHGHAHCYDQEAYDSLMPTAGEVKAVLTDLRDLNFYRPSVTMKKAIDVISKLSAKKLITGEIRKGLLTLDKVPAGVYIDIRDYDIADHGNYEAEIETDEDNREFTPLRWEA